MKVCFNIKFVEGPFGGAMQFAKSLRTHLKKNDIDVVNDLNDDDIDIILHIAPFPHMEICAFSFLDAYRYKLSHPNTIIILRINECDERKNTHYINKLIIQASQYSDYLVYIASWLKPLFEKQGINPKIPSSVILNGADQNIFNLNNKISWNGNGKLKIVTHHFGGNYMKGHDIYMKFDQLLKEKRFSDLFEFTFIGNIPSEASYKNTKIISPLFGKELSDELKKHHAYLTATRNEPAGMHHIEGALCGLPVLYLESGALPEYCHAFGIGFTETNFIERLHGIRNRYTELFEKIKGYCLTSDYMNEQYQKLILALLEKRSDFTPNRRAGQLSDFSFFLRNKILYINSFMIRLKEFIRSNFQKIKREFL